MSIDMLDLAIKLDSSEFDKVINRINQEMQNVVKTAATMNEYF